MATSVWPGPFLVGLGPGQNEITQAKTWEHWAPQTKFQPYTDLYGENFFIAESCVSRDSKDNNFLLI